MSGPRKSNIPIPSFSLQAIPINTDGEQVVEAIGIPVPASDEDEGHITTTTTTTTYKIPPNNKQFMIGLETALQLHLNQNKTSGISFKEFCKLVPKVIMSLPSVRTPTPLPSNDNQATEKSSTSSSLLLYDFSTEERLWHDLYCVAVPTLYKIVRLDSSSSSMMMMGFEPVPVAGNRFKQFRRLLEEAMTRGVSKERSDEAREMILSHRETEAARNGQPASKESGMNAASLRTKNEEAASKIIIRPEMDLFERVKAKEVLRQKYLREADTARKGPNMEDRVTLADVLFSHARHVLRRRTQMQRRGAAKTAATTKCVTTFRALAPSLPKFSTEYCTKLLLGIVETCPGWISWIDPKKGENAVPISKDATVTIETADYKRIRAKLNGEKVDDKKMAPRSRLNRGLVLRQNTTRATSRSNNSSNQTRAAPATVSGAKRTLAYDDDGDDQQQKANSAKSSRKSLTTSSAAQATASAHKKAPAMKKLDLGGGEESSSSSSSKKNFKKRPAEDNSSSKSESGEVEDQPQKKRAALRVNPNFILCDADHDGGDILQPSQELPRGLQKLFMQANAGERV